MDVRDNEIWFGTLVRDEECYHLDSLAHTMALTWSVRAFMQISAYIPHFILRRCENQHSVPSCVEERNVLLACHRTRWSPLASSSNASSLAGKEGVSPSNLPAEVPLLGR